MRPLRNNGADYHHTCYCSLRVPSPRIPSHGDSQSPLTSNVYMMSFTLGRSSAPHALSGSAQPLKHTPPPKPASAQLHPSPLTSSV